MEPIWDLKELYSSPESDEYKADFALYTSLIEELGQLLQTARTFTVEANGNFDFPAWLDTYLQKYNQFLGLKRTLGCYAYIIYSTDTTNSEYLNNISRLEKYDGEIALIELNFSSILVTHEIYLEEFYRRYPKYKEYDFLISEIISGAKHNLSAAEEKIICDLNQTAGSAWSMLQEQITSNLTDSQGRTFNELRNLAYSANPQERKQAWETEISLLKNNSIALGASLNNLKGQTITVNDYRKYTDALERSLDSNRLGRKTLEALIGAIEESLPEWRRYFKAKAAYLRKTGNTASSECGKDGQGLAFYDLFAPCDFAANAAGNITDTATAPSFAGNTDTPTGTASSMLSKTWTFAEARAFVEKEFSSFSNDMGNFASMAFEKNWIDAKVRPGKVGGAYDEDFPKGHQSRVLTNFTGSFSDIITLAHELGHAYHFSCLKGMDPITFDYPMTLAETASTFAETIVKQDMIAMCSDKEKFQMLELDLQDAAQVLVDILCRFYFEQSVFQERKNSTLNADDFCRLMSQAQEKTYGNGLCSERHPYMWAVKCHYYMTDLDFYNYPYAFGQLFAAGLYAKFKEEGSAFAEYYPKLLAKTGSLSCEEVCRQAGFDITTKDFWRKGIGLYLNEINQFCQLSNI